MSEQTTRRTAKRAQPSTALRPVKIYVGELTRQRVEQYRRQRDGKRHQDAWRDIIWAGLNALGIINPPGAP